MAAAGKLSVVAAGPSTDIAQAKPVLDAIGTKTIVMGNRPVEAAAAKAALNFGIAAIIEMLSEQIRIADAQDVPAMKLVDLMTATNFGQLMVSVYGPIIAEQQIEPAGSPDLCHHSVKLPDFTVTIGWHERPAKFNRPIVGISIHAHPRVNSAGSVEHINPIFAHDFHPREDHMDKQE